MTGWNRGRSGQLAFPAVGQNPDEALLAGFATRSEEPALAFIQRFQSNVHGIALAVTGDSVLAQEIAMSAFEQAAQDAGTFDRRSGSVGTWLAGLTAKMAMDAIGDADPQDPANQDHGAHVRSTLHRLPTDQARILVLASMAGLTTAQVAFTEGIPIETARMRIRAAMNRLRAELVQNKVDGAVGNVP